MDQSEGLGEQTETKLAETSPKSNQPNQLITITLDTYKASRLNSMISRHLMRIEPIENYLSEQQKREAKRRKE